MTAIANAPQTLPTALVRSCQHQVQQLMEQITGLTAVVISTSDGFELANASRGNTASPAKLAAMACSISALGLMAGEEGHVGQCQNITIEADEGVIVILAIPHAQFPLILSLVATRDTLLGQALYLAKRAVGELVRVGS